MQTPTPLSRTAQAEPGYCLLAAETFVIRIQEIQNQVEGARKNEDIECVHKLRVASRRMRAALNIFGECVPKKKIKTWKKTVKNLTTSCGAARDTDVLIAFLQDYSNHAGPRVAPGIEYITMMHKARRGILQSNVVRALDLLEAIGTLAEISDSGGTIRDRLYREKASVKTLSTFEKARDHITARLDDLLTLGRFVHDQNAITKHHELRIAAKWLRYTMEIFSNMYSKGLADQISLMKKFQDILGEMHDYYVWSEDLRAHGDEIPAHAKYGLNRLLVHLGALRRARYKNFVALWDDAIAKDLFAGIRQQTDIGPGSDILHGLLRNESRIALISDVHGNLDALKAVVRDAQQSGLDMFLNAGDAIGFGIYPSQVIQTIQLPMFLNVIGNVDLEILEALNRSKPDADNDPKAIAAKELTRSDIMYLRSLPRQLRIQIAGKNVLVTHGSPDSVEEHIYPDTPEERLKEIATQAAADVIVTGHTHRQMNRNVNGVTFANPGSVGRPVSGDPRAEYAVLTLNPLAVEFRTAEYDVETLANRMRKKALPENHVQVILRGIRLDTIKKQEKDLSDKQLWKNRSTIRRVRDAAHNFLPDGTHAEQDRRLALIIFDRTKKLHSLGPEERYWLECAAILHDIGLSRKRKGHHKLSLRLILNDPALPFTQKERFVIGSIARYHRKAFPTMRHFNLTPLSRMEREKVAVLASILRVADALDCSHRSVVRNVKVSSFPNHIVLECLVSGQHYMEDQSVRKKKRLFEKVFNSELAIVWRPNQVTGEHVLPWTNTSVSRNQS